LQLVSRVTEAEILEVVKPGELSQGEAARGWAAHGPIAYRVDPEFPERQRVAHLEENMASEQIKRKRARLLVKNMTPEQAERRAAYYRRYRAAR
jgi:hypothetical protein